MSEKPPVEKPPEKPSEKILKALELLDLHLDRIEKHEQLIITKLTAIEKKVEW